MARITERMVYNFLQQAGVDPVQAPKVVKIFEGEFGPLQKDTVPARPMMDHRLYEGSGPFGAFDTEITSLVVDGGSELMNWLPMRPIEARTTRVSHLEWLAPTGFDGSLTYPEFLRGLELGECDYPASGTGWNGFTYEVTGGSYGWRTNSIKRYEDSGIHYYKEQPMITFRGGPSVIGGTIDNDADWAIAKLLWQLQNHGDYVLSFGDRANSEMEWDGVEQILQPGYVAAHIVGGGSTNWAEPLWINAAGMNDIWRILQTLRVMVRTLRKRASVRRWRYGAADMIVRMGTTMWENLREAIAAGAMYQFSSVYGFDGEITFRDYRGEYAATSSNGTGMAALDIDGMPIVVMLDPNMEGSVMLTVDDGAGGTVEVPAVLGDIQVLTRRAGNMTFWWQEWLDWDKFTKPNAAQFWNDEDRFMLQNGMVRAGVVKEASKCAYYFGEMVGRVTCTMLPMQGVISSVVIPVLHEMELEQAAYWTRNFYGFGGRGIAGGEGTARLTPQP